VILLLGLVLGAAAGRALAALLGPALSTPLFARTNHRGATVPTAAGLVVALAALAVEAVLALADAAGLADLSISGAIRILTLAAVLGFALLGLVDDLAGSGLDGRGFGGHLRALAAGRLTTGGLKLLGGAALGVVVCFPLGTPIAELVVDALLVALAANLGNLFDRAPGRTTKVALLALAVLAVAVGFDEELVGVAVVVGAAAGLLGADLGERLMLGDTGANAIGAVLGFGVVVTATPTARAATAVALLALNLVSEVVSFSRVIDRVAPLRVLDRLGRLPRSGGPP
jgi:UDP-N-acetylmuramyl pentapeptide phosphotransferase/UDP-N-acetylglucosamine-1-phosphate transferase